MYYILQMSNIITFSVINSCYGQNCEGELNYVINITHKHRTDITKTARTKTYIALFINEHILTDYLKLLISPEIILYTFVRRYIHVYLYSSCIFSCTDDVTRLFTRSMARRIISCFRPVLFFPAKDNKTCNSLTLKVITIC